MDIFDTKRKMGKMANLSPVCHHREADEEEHNDIKLTPPEIKPTDCQTLANVSNVVANDKACDLR